MRENGKQNANVTSQEKRGDGISSFLLNAISGYFADQITDAMWNNVFNTNTMDAIGASMQSYSLCWCTTKDSTDGGTI